MLRYVITKNGKTYKSYTDFHCEIVVSNGLRYADVIQEGIIDRGIHYLVSRKDVVLPSNIEKAREIETLYAYGFLKEGD